MPFSVVHATQFRQGKNEATRLYRGDNLLPVGTHFKYNKDNLFVDWNEINE